MTYPNLADPNSWATGLATPDQFKHNITDPLNAGETYQSFTPTLQALTTNPTGWTTFGQYVQVGKRVSFDMSFVASSGFNNGNGIYLFGLPVRPAYNTIYCVGQGIATNNWYNFMALMTADSGNQSCCLIQPGTQTRLGHLGPYSNAWVTNNTIVISGTYRAL